MSYVTKLVKALNGLTAAFERSTKRKPEVCEEKK